MTKKQEALNKAKESWKKILEWWKETIGWAADIVWWTAWALWYTLLSGWEAMASKISESREDDEWISRTEKQRRKNNTQEYNTRAKKHIKKAWHLGKKAVLWIWKAVKWWARTLWHTAKAWYHLIDAWDKVIGEKIEKRQIEKGKKPWKVSKFVRDNIIKLMIALWVAWYWWYEWWKYITEKNEDWKEIVVNVEDWNSSEISIIPTSEYNLLNWKTITSNAPLTRRYLWWDLENSWNLIIWDTLTLNSAESLHNLWTKKIQKYGQSTKDISHLDKIDVSVMTPEEIENFRVKYPIDATYLFIAKPYIDWKENKWKMSLDQFMQQSNQIIKTLKVSTESYDWWLTGDKKDLFETIREDITWECIVAYAMTELCENKENWEFNKQLFDLLLKNSWVNYLSNVPAIYDWKTSYGLYQFTEYALYDRNWEKRWASFVNQYLPNWEKIPWSVIDLRTWEDQTKAAYLFALYNLNNAVKNLTDQQAKDLLSYQKNHKDNFKNNITQLIAMCHHFPVDKKALRKWHEANHKSDIYNYGKAQTYGKASKNNYEALKK